MHFISGLRNYHKVGINGYILSKRLSDRIGMIRVVHATGNSLRTLHKDDGDFNFAPHNHRQDITLIGLVGMACNVTFRFDPRLSGHFGFEYRFNSELIDGKMGVHFHGVGDLDIDDIVPLTANPIFMPSHSVHTIIAEPGAAWLIVEGDLATMKYPHHKNLCYSKLDNFKLETTPDLYQPLEMEDLIVAWDVVGRYINPWLWRPPRYT